MPTAFYISPFFPPLARVGALAPLKMVRGLQQHGWRSVVLCDLWDGAPTDLDLVAAVPEETVVHRDFSGRAKAAEERLFASGVAASDRATASSPGFAWPDWITRREWLPLGEMGFNIGHALAAGRRLLAEHSCAVIIAHSTPVASLVVGELLARETGLPFVTVLGDPWMPCELRRPLRPIHTALIEAWRERRVVRQAARMVLFTEAARDAYRARYPDIDRHRFTRTHHAIDRDLIMRDRGAGFDRFTLLFLGAFTRFVRPDPFLALLAELKRRGIGADRLALSPTSALDAAGTAKAQALGVQDMVRPAPRVSYRAVGATMAAADMLLMAAPTAQRIQAKFYDYLASERPLLVVADDHPELDALLRATNAGRRFAGAEIGAMADYVEAQLKSGRHPVCRRNEAALDALTVGESGRALSAILDDVTGRI